MPRSAYKPDSARSAFARFLTGEEDTDGNCKGFCPLCEDPDTSKSPSASFKFATNQWICFTGTEHATGSISSLTARLRKTGFDPKREAQKSRMLRSNVNPLAAINAERKRTAANADGEPMPIDEMEAYVLEAQRRLYKPNSPQLKAFQDKRGLSDETMRRFGIGVALDRRYTIPILDGEGNLVNVRRYLMNASRDKDKMISIKGHGSARLFNEQALRHDEVILAEGELDAITLEQHGFPALSVTAGAGNFPNSFVGAFVGKDVYVVYDVDDSGRKGAMNACQRLAAVARSVHRIELPLVNKGADVTDYFHNEGYTATDFRGLMDKAEHINVMSHGVAEDPADSGRVVTLEESMSEALRDEVIEMRATVTGKQNPPYSVPRKFSVTCSMNKGPACEMCPVAMHNGDMDYEIARDDPQLFDFVDTNRDKFKGLMQGICGASCTSHSQYTVEDTYHVEELIVGNSVDERSIFGGDKPVSRSVYSVSTHDTGDNTDVRLVGRNVPSMRNQRLMFMAWINDPVRTSIDKFTLDDTSRKELSVFQVKADDPDNVQTPLDKCFEIARDNAKYQTHIYGRDLLHVAYDLVWHSPLAFYVEGKLMEKGWLEMMVVGDTRTGKSETAIRLAEHYRSGVVKSCESMSFAGLVGGNQQVGSGSWITTWGVIPLNDRRLVVLDEVSGLKEKDVIENMSSIRSSGVAQITKINTQSTSARTRIIWVTNPGDGAMIDERSGQGVDAMRTIVKNQEDVARFDFVMAARASEVDPSEINRAHSAKGAPRYPSKVSSDLVLWAWSLKPDDIDFSDSAVEEARRISQSIGEEYVADPPLIQAENFRFKLYRIAAAIAARTFYIQWPKKGQMKLRVNADHIRDAKRFLDMVYGPDGGMGYQQSSRRIIEDRRRAVGNRGNAKNYLLENPDTVLTTLRSVQQDTKFRGRDFEDFGGMQRDAALIAVTTLQKMGMIKRLPQGYIRMDKVLVSVLRELEEE